VVHGVGAAAGAVASCPFQGRVRALHVAPGDEVRAGSPLLDIDVPELAVAAAEATGTRREASVHAERLESLEPLLDQGLVPVERLHESEHLLAEVNTRRSVALAKLRSTGMDEADVGRLARRGYLTLTAPIDGTVLEVDARIGAAVLPDRPLVRLVGQGPVRVEVRLTRPVRGSARLAGPDGEIPLRPIGQPVRDPASGLWVSFFEPTGEEVELHDGERLPVSLDDAEGGGELQVPAQALRPIAGSGAGPREAQVLRLRDGVRGWVSVQVARVHGTTALVRGEGLRVGDRVAIDPADVLGTVAESEESPH